MAAGSSILSKIIFRKPAFWGILFLLVFISLPYYVEALSPPDFLTQVLTDSSLARHSFERILYLIPVFMAGFFFGWQGSLAVSIISLLLMVPRALFITQYPTEALFESGGIFVFAIMLTVAFGIFHKERAQRAQLEEMHNRLWDSDESLHYYVGQATRAQEAATKRIALELHDGTIQDLVALSRHLDVLGARGRELSADNILLLQTMKQQVKDIIQSLRDLSQNLRPPTLDRLGLVPALEHLASEVTERAGISVKVKVLGAERRLSEEEELMLFRIAQEALRNVSRHSQAVVAEITLEFGENGVKLTISDDGKGFYPVGALDNLARDNKLGLLGMQERARLIKGNLLVKSVPGRGTTVTVEARI